MSECPALPPAPIPAMGGLFGGPPPTIPPTNTLGAFGDDDDIFDLPEESEEPPPMPPIGTVELRDYQEKAVRSVIDQFNGKVNSTLVVAATGTGKSVVLAELAKRFNGWGHSVLLLVHRDELIRQLVKSCSRVGVPAFVEKANERALQNFRYQKQTSGAATVCASVQTLKGARLESWPEDAFRLIIIDEAHHAAAPSYGSVIDYFSGARVAGFTATADRLDGKNIGKVFETLAFEYNVRDAIKDGWLVPIEAMQLETDPKIDLRDLRITAGDFNTGDLERAVNDNIGVLVNSIVDTKALGDRRTIAFTPDISSANALALALEDVGITARAVHGKSPDRAEIFAGHQSGRFQVMVNCMIATEGYDDPQISCVLICRPTKSRGLYSQMVGRGTRLHPESGKEKCRIVDFAYLTGDHDLVAPVDLYDNSEVADEVVKIARDLMASGRETQIEAALEAAQIEFERTQRVRIRRQAVSVRANRFDPVAACSLFGIAEDKAAYSWQDVRRATPKQIDALRKWGITAPDDMGFGVASKLLNTIFGRKAHGWTSPRQVAQLIESGVDPEAAVKMREGDAKAHLEANPLRASEKQVWFLTSRGWNREEAAQLTRKQASEEISRLKTDSGR